MTSLAVITPVGPAQDHLCEQTALSVQNASKCSTPFSSIEHIFIEDKDDRLGPSSARNKGIEKALRKGLDWLLFLDAGDIINATAFPSVESFLDTHDAIWGMISDFMHGQSQATLRSGQSGIIENFFDWATCDPMVSTGRGFFVKAASLQNFRFDESTSFSDDFTFHINLWKNCRCIKLDTVLCANRHGFQSTGRYSQNFDAWISDARLKLVNLCCTEQLTKSFRCLGQDFQFYITNPFDIIQRSLLHGVFFEQMELFALKALARPGGTIIDAGANIGNHTIFFSKLIGADRVIPFECNPKAIDLLTRNIRINKCDNIDMGFLGIGLAEEKGTGSISQSKTNNLGATRFKQDPNGMITFDTIDAFELDNVSLIKIDCEGMDISVIRGASKTIEKKQPVLFFECFNDQYKEAMEYLNKIGYMTIHEFGYVNSRNIVAIPSTSEKDP